MSINWTNEELRFIHNEDIVEYDIKSANTSLMEYYNLAPLEVITRLRNMKKEDREIAVGKRMRSSSEFAIHLEDSFTKIVNEFLEVNRLDRSEDVVSIKKDAVFVRNRNIKVSQFGPVLYRPKGHYDGFINIPRYEFYHKKDGSIDVKGINDSMLPMHQDGVLTFINGLFNACNDTLFLIEYLKTYAKLYKDRELPFNAYREFTGDSKFKVRMLGSEILMDQITEELLMDGRVDISYNYINVYMPILKIVIGGI